MRVRILTGIAGPRFSYRRNQSVDLDDATARDWIDRGMAAPFAEPAHAPYPVEERGEEQGYETAEAPTYETTSRPTSRRRRRR